jgi:hypothetical protein
MAISDRTYRSFCRIKLAGCVEGFFQLTYDLVYRETCVLVIWNRQGMAGGEVCRLCRIVGHVDALSFPSSHKAQLSELQIEIHSFCLSASLLTPSIADCRRPEHL